MNSATHERIVGATVAGKYRIRRVVGTGSMGVVCEAEHLEIGKRVAIKLIEASLVGLDDIAMRFRQEARAASLVESHHIVQVFDVGADDALGLYLVMEFLTGEDLAATLMREKRLATGAAVRIAIQVARGLAKAHEVGVVHRDLKPANIFLCARDEDEPLVKILDFGISKVGAPAGFGQRVTRAGTVVGTPQYMSPEQARGLAVDERTDVWSLGLVLYEMLAGRPAYPELPTYEQFIIHLASTPPDPLRDVAPWVPASLADVVQQSLAHDIDARIPRSSDLARRLIDVQALIGTSTAHPSSEDGGDTAPFDAMADGDLIPRTLIMDERPALDDAARFESSRAPSPVLPSRDRIPLVASGIRGATRGMDAEHEENRPQFFDRRALRLPGLKTAPVAIATALPPGAEAAQPSGSSVAESPFDPSIHSPPSRGATRSMGAWVAFTLLALVVAASLALSFR